MNEKTETKTIEAAKIKAGEWRFVFIIIALVLFLTSLPYLFGVLTAPPEKRFVGIMLDIPDHAQYFSWMREFKTANLSANKLTPEPNAPIFFNLLWWGLARLSNLTGLGFGDILQVLRFSATLVFLPLVYWLSAWFFEDVRKRRAAFLVTTFTSGFGWVLVVLKYTLTNGELLFPLDLYVAEANTFLCILAYPHFVAAAIYIFVFDLILRGAAKGQLRYAVGAGFFALFLGWQHAYDLISVYFVLAAYAGLRLIRDRKIPMYLFWSGLIVGLISGWPALYSVLLTSLDPLWEEVLAQFKNAGVFTPNLLHLVILLGLAFLFAIYTLIRKNPFDLRAKSNNELFVIGWFLVTFVLIYLPVDYQIHLLNGWQVPIAIMVTWGLFDYVMPYVQGFVEKRKLGWTKERVQKLVMVGFIALILPTNVYLLVWRFTDLARYDYPFYLYEDEFSAFDWLEANADGDDVVLSSLTTGQYVPMFTGTHAFLAHWAQTVDFYTKSEIVDEFFATDKNDAWRGEVFADYSVDYVLHGPAEAALGDYDPAESASLTLVFDAGQVQVYKVLLKP
ncbi:MAG: hypothetical protein JXB38_06345 [Anaerolineales bacterium]|nr:hypothetical protein [Anaerolineales bacterium]